MTSFSPVLSLSIFLFFSFLLEHGGEDSRPSADPYLSGVCFFYIPPGVSAHENRSPRICRDFFFLEWSSSYHPSRLSNKSLSKAQGKHKQQTHTLPAAPCTGVGWSRNSSGRPFKSHKPFPERNMKSLLSFLFFSNEKWRGTTRISRKS